MKLYAIEVDTESSFEFDMYRFRSLFNSCVGIWYDEREIAVTEGETHQKIIETIYPELGGNNE